jgi:uncharacterized protein YndB with AHSA1/START domain
MPTKKTTKKTVKKTAVSAAKTPKKLPVGKGPVVYTTSNTFKASVSEVWAAATEAKHLKAFFVDDMRGEFSKKSVEWFWKEWGWMPLEVVKYVKNKELVMLTGMTGTYKVTVRYEIVRAKGKTIFRIHESGYPTKDLRSAFMMCEGWTEFHCHLKAHLMGVDLRKAG